MKHFPLRSLLFVLAASLLMGGLVVWLAVREVREERKDRALISALKQTDALAVAHLLDEGANANARDLPDDKRPLWRKYWDLLPGRHRSIEANTATALMLATEGDDGDTEPPANILMMAALLKHGADPNTLDGERECPLSYALDNRRTEAALLLIDHGAKVTEKGNDHFYPWLPLAVMNGAEPCVLDAMLKHGADIDAPYESGGTALMYAASRGDVPAVQLLLAHHANFRIKDYHGLTSLDVVGRNMAPKDDDIVTQITHLLRQARAH